VKALWRSPALGSAVIYGASGLGFAGANLILARVLPTAEYGLFTLVVALVNLGHALGTLGVDGVVTRRHLDAGPDLLRRAVLAAFCVALALSIISEVAYRLTLPLLLVVFIATLWGGTMMVAAARFQSEERFGVSLALMQSPNLVLLLAAGVVVVSSIRTATIPLYIVALGMVVAAMVGWWLLLREWRARPSAARLNRFPWGEALSFAGLNGAGLLLVQLDRLVIPYVLSVHDLATYGVLAAIAGSLFRVLSMGVGYTLVPRLRVASGVAERRTLVAREAKLIGVVVVAGSAVIWFVTPFVEQWFLAGKYHLAGALLVAAIVSGVAKIANSFTKSIVSALATARELSLVNLLSWGSVALAIPAAVIGARWGLTGVIYGVALGWGVRAMTAFAVTYRHLRLPAPLPAAAQ
jgi:O-antigen/teichoic acid export membrane protein